MNLKRKLALLPLFLGGLLALHLLAETIYVRVAGPGEMVTMRDDLLKNGRDAPILLTGDSHTKYGLLPEMLEGSYNYSMNGMSPCQNYYALKQVLEDDLIHPELVILADDLHTYAPYRATELKPEADNARVVDLLEVGRRRGEEYTFGKMYVRSRFSYLGRAPDFVLALWRSFTGSVGAPSPFYAPWDTRSPERRRADVLKKFEEQFRDGPGPDEAFVSYTVEILKLCRERGIEVLLLRYPVPQEYLDEYKRLYSIEDYYAQAAELMGEFADVPRWDFQSAYATSADHFSDQDHLSQIGRERLTNEVAARLQNGPISTD